MGFKIPYSIARENLVDPKRVLLPPLYVKNIVYEFVVDPKSLP
jgi:hypothetical protein